MPEPSRPHRIGILAPMPSELGPVVRTLSLQRSTTGDTRLHTGAAGDVEVVATRTGIGTQLATQATERLLDTADVDHVMVVGIAGGVGATQVRDVVLPGLVVDRATGRGFKPSPLVEHATGGTLVTSDEFLIEPATVAQLVADGVVALDMETAAVAAVCEARNVPWSVVRAISDRADEHQDDSILGLANADGSPRVGASLRYMLRHPGRIPRLMRLANNSRAAAELAAAEAALQIRSAVFS